MFDALRTFYHITCVKNIHIEPFFIAKRTFYYVTVADICNLLRLIKRGYGSECSVSFFQLISMCMLVRSTQIISVWRPCKKNDCLMRGTKRLTSDPPNNFIHDQV